MRISSALFRVPLLRTRLEALKTGVLLSWSQTTSIGERNRDQAGPRGFSQSHKGHGGRKE